jgi:hypothetical protein
VTVSVRIARAAGVRATRVGAPQTRRYEMRPSWSPVSQW